MGHQGEAPIQGGFGIFQLQVTFAVGETLEDRAEVAVHRGERLQESLLAQGGHGFDAQQQLLTFLAEHLEALLQLRQPDFQLLQLFERQHVHRFEGFHAGLEAAQLFLQRLQTRLAHLRWDLRPGIGQLPLQLLEAQLVAAQLLGQGVELFSQALQLPLLLLQGLALG